MKHLFTSILILCAVAAYGQDTSAARGLTRWPKAIDSLKPVPPVQRVHWGHYVPTTGGKFTNAGQCNGQFINDPHFTKWYIDRQYQGPNRTFYTIVYRRTECAVCHEVREYHRLYFKLN